jgi:hypothetical protein
MMKKSSTAPASEKMLRDQLNPYDSMFVKQTKKGCLQELFGCEAKNEFKIFPSAEDAKQAGLPETMYSLEESSCFQRFCFGNKRGFTQTVWSGPLASLPTDPKGVPVPSEKVVMTMEKKCSLALSPCCCCCLPAISFGGPDGSPLGGAEMSAYFYLPFCCYPKVMVKDETGQDEYVVKMPECLGGMCIDIFAEGSCNCKVPFYIYPAASKCGKGDEVGKIIKVWRGLGTEVFTDADSFQLNFPPGINAAGKARMLGTTMLLNMLFFEKQK